MDSAMRERPDSAGSMADTPPESSVVTNERRRSVEGIVRLMAERELPPPRGGLLVWGWIVSIPVLSVVILFGLLIGSLNLAGALYLSLFVLTGRAISKLSLEASHQHAALLLSDLDESWIGPLIDSLVYPHADLRSIARLRLTAVLPTAGDDAHSQLTPVQRALLFDQLTPHEAARHPEFVQAILQFGRSMGDELALEGTTRLACLIAPTMALGRVVRTAKRVLPGLEARIAEQIADRAAPGETRQAGQTSQGTSELSTQARALINQAEEEEANRSPGMRFAFLVAVYLTVLPYGLWQTIEGLARGDWFKSAVFAAGTALMTQAHRLTLTPQQARIGSHLATLDDVHVVGPLAEMLTWPDARINAAATAGLTRLLPKMQSSDTHLLDARQRSLLYQTLRLPNARRHAEFMIALLQALEQVGDTGAIAVVTELSNSQPATLRQQRVVEAAQRCLPFLEGCAQQNQNSQVLLRATTADSDEALLRAASQTALSPDVLVRVAQAAEDAG